MVVTLSQRKPSWSLSTNSSRSSRGSPPSCFAIFPTAWGDCGIAWKNHESESSPAGFTERPPHALLSRILLPGLSISELREQLLKTAGFCDEVLGDGRGNFHPEVVPEWVPALVRALQAYYADAAGDLAALPPPSPSAFEENWAYWRVRLDWSGLTAFQRCVLEETARIPRGMHVTYGQLAQRIGKPAASRAVGAALGANPWPILVPCHRVVGQGGKLTGFSAPGGVVTKRRMLAMEGAALFGA